MSGRPVERTRDAAAAIASRALLGVDLSELWANAEPEAAKRIEREVRRWSDHLRDVSGSPDVVDRSIAEVLAAFAVPLKE
jgi:hypothetical protein